MTVTKHVTVAAFAIACMVGTLVLLRSYQHGEAVPVRRPLREMPLRIDAWQGEESDLSAAVLRTLGASDYTMRTYHDAEGGGGVVVHGVLPEPTTGCGHSFAEELLSWEWVAHVGIESRDARYSGSKSKPCAGE